MSQKKCKIVYWPLLWTPWDRAAWPAPRAWRRRGSGWRGRPFPAPPAASCWSWCEICAVCCRRGRRRPTDRSFLHHLQHDHSITQAARSRHFSHELSEQKKTGRDYPLRKQFSSQWSLWKPLSPAPSTYELVLRDTRKVKKMVSSQGIIEKMKLEIRNVRHNGFKWEV